MGNQREVDKWHIGIPLNPYNAEATFVQRTKTQISLKPSKPCHVGIHWIAHAEYS